MATLSPMLCPRCWGSGRGGDARCGLCQGFGNVPDVQLSPHFRLAELLRSDSAVRLGLSQEVTPEQVEQLRVLCVDGLEWVRAILGVPVHVSSGYRASAVNTAVGGTDDSAHVHCLAADLEPIGMSVGAAMQKLQAAGVKCDQVLFEPWLHFGLRRPATGEQRQQFAVYLPGPDGKRQIVPFDVTNPRVRAVTGLA